MRVLQLIDSLRPGGAEQMAVSYANVLAKRIDGSFLCCTRLEGLLKKKLSPEVGYLFLGKKSTLDLRAFWALREFVKQNRIHIIQAHSSSWFLALQVKLSLPYVKLVWHDHYGRELKRRKVGLLGPASRYFHAIISVNPQLEQWAKEKLNSKEVHYFQNFLPDSEKHPLQKPSLLKGDANAFKIICVANLRPQKDHLTLLKAFGEMLEKENNISLHLIGIDNGDAYSQKVKGFIRQTKLNDKAFLYGEQEEISLFLEQADLGVLSSVSEGLPVALLEYGRARLPVVCTAVGKCADVVGEDGKVVPPGNPEALAAAILFYHKNEPARKIDAGRFQRKVMEEFSEQAVIPGLLNLFRN